MRARDAVGRKIVAIHQERFWDVRGERMDTHISAIELDNGVKLCPRISELDDGYGLDFQVVAKRPEKGTE